MHVVFHAVYDNGFATCFIDEITDNTLYRAAPGLIQHSRSVLYCKYSLHVYLVVGVGHVYLFTMYMCRAYGSHVYISVLLFHGLKSMVTRFHRGYATRY